MEKLFGRAYESIGSTGSDFIIKTKGQVKIQWGSKFIDIVKNGKIAVDTDIIESINSENEIPSKNGIYYVKDSGSIFIVIDGNKINLIGEIGTTYVSFLGKQDTTGEQKEQALENIGLLYETEEEALSSGVKYGIMYIQDRQKVYTMNNGKLSEYTFEIPNPYPTAFVISKEDSTIGALVVKGSGKENALVTGNIYIYDEDGAAIIDGEMVSFKVNGSNKIEISDNEIVVNNKTTFNKEIISNNVQSLGASSVKGFKLYVSGGQSTLEVDNIIWRNDPSSGSTYDYPSRWFQQESTIKTVLDISESETDVSVYELTLFQPSIYGEGNLLCTYTTVEYDDFIESMKIALRVVSSEDNTLITEIETVSGSESAKEEFFNNIEHYLAGKKIFFVASGKPITRLSHNNIDLLNINSIAEEEDINNIKTRIGSIQDLNFTKEGFNIGTLAEGNIGIYSDNLVTVGAKQINSSIYAPTFKASPNGEFPKYDSGFNIPVDDDSKTVVTSEWVNDKTDKRLEEYVRKDQLISLIESYIQPVDGTRSNPVTLVAGTIRRATNSTTDWYFIGGKKARITDVQVTVKDGLMTITLVPASGSTINVLAVSAVIGDTGEFNGDFSITSRGGRGAGAHWCNAIPDPNTSGVIRVREYHQANGNNDSWGTANWNYSNGPISLSFAAFGYIVG